MLNHAIEPADEERILHESVVVKTRYDTKLWFGIVVTTEDASLEPGRSVTWRHVDGPLTGSVETFRIEPRDSGSLVQYEGEIHARNVFLRGPLERLFVAPQTRKVSMGALRQAREELDHQRRE